VNGGARARDALERTVIAAAHERETRLLVQTGAGAGELHMAAHRVRRTVDGQQQRLILGLSAEGVVPARDDAQDAHHVARRGEHGDLAALQRRMRMAQC